MEDMYMTTKYGYRVDCCDWWERASSFSLSSLHNFRSFSLLFKLLPSVLAYLTAKTHTCIPEPLVCGSIAREWNTRALKKSDDQQYWQLLNIETVSV